MSIWKGGHDHVWGKAEVDETELERIVSHRCVIDGCNVIVSSYERLKVQW